MAREPLPEMLWTDGKIVYEAQAKEALAIAAQDPKIPVDVKAVIGKEVSQMTEADLSVLATHDTTSKQAASPKTVLGFAREAAERAKRIPERLQRGLREAIKAKVRDVTKPK